MNRVNRRLGYLALTIVLLFGLYFLYFGLRYPYMDITIEQTKTGDWIVTEEPESYRWGSQYINKGDIIREVDGQPLDKIPFIVKTKRLHMAEKDLLIVRNGNSYIVNVPAFATADTFITDILIPLPIFLILMLLSWRAYRTKGDELDTKLLIAFSLSVGLSYVCSVASARGEFIGALLVRSLLVSVPVFFMHFLYAFFANRQAKPFIPFVFIKIGYVAVGCWFLMQPLYLWSDIFSIIPSNVWKTMVLATFLILQLVVFVSLIVNYLRSSGRERTLHTYILTGQIVAFSPFILLYVLPTMIFGSSIVRSEVTTITLTAIPIVCFYILKVKEVMDIQFVLYRLRYYGLLALWPSLLIVALLMIIMQGPLHTGIKWLQSFLMIYFLMVLLFYARDFSPLKFRNAIFKAPILQSNRPELLLKNLSKVMNVSDLEITLIKEVEAVLNVSSIAILEYTEHSFHIKQQLGSIPDMEVLEVISQTLKSIREPGCMVPVSAGSCLLYGIKNGRSQVLWFGSKYNQTKLNPAELSWLYTLLNYATLLYVNLQLSEDFIGEFEKTITVHKLTPPWLLRLLFSISENERKRLGSDLHDSALQDQLLMYKRLESALTKAEVEQPIRAELEQIRDGLLDVVGQIRETCNELRPPFLKEIGIEEAIHNLLKQARLRTNFSIHFDSGAFHAELDEHQVLTLYRIVQELLQNASKHAKGATTISLQLKSTAETVQLGYQDNGEGMILGKLKSSFTHMGLWGIQERIVSLEGTMHLESEPGKGFSLELQIPLHVSYTQPAVSS